MENKNQGLVDNNNQYRQISIFDLINKANDGANVSISDIDEMIRTLQEKKNALEKEERKRREEEERIRKEQEIAAREAEKEAHIAEVTSMDLPMDWDNAFLSDERTKGVHTDSISDGLIICLNTLGKVDIEFISSITGKDYKTVICALKGSIYQNPEVWEECFYKGWELANEYLSGNLMRKLNAAKAADAEYKGYFADNIKALEKVLPKSVATKDIYITLGSPWVPADIIDDFITYLFGEPKYILKDYGDGYKTNDDPVYRTIHDEQTGTWEIPFKARYKHRVSVQRNYGTERMEALHILEKTLNMKTVSVVDEEKKSWKKRTKRVINQTETLAALEKQQLVIKKFKDWVWKDEGRAERLKNIFENQYSCIRKRTYDGSFLSFPKMSSRICLYKYQRDAVARIILSPNTLLAHDVGAGKTYVMVAAGMELKRMGLSKKNMYVVPNNIVGQWRDIFLEMYPKANLLCIEPKVFKPDKREEILKKVRDEEYDGIIIAYSCFERIPISKKYYLKEMMNKQAQIAEIASNRSKATRRVKRKQENLNKAVLELQYAIEDEYNTVYFDELGITRLFVDEAHNFKNVPFDTQANNVLGINSTGSAKCQDMLEKVHMVQKQNQGGGVVFATGTPITNSITDAYIMQLYLQSGELAMLDIQSFDGWIGMFAEKITQFEIDVDTSTYRLATRFAKFHNLPELTVLLSSIADFHQIDKSAGIPDFDGHTDALISKSPEFAYYLNDISERADSVRKGYVWRTEDNMLKITSDGRKAALDLRLVIPGSSKTMQSKVVRCAENVADIYMKALREKSTQIVFCDISTPKDEFNIYDELRDLLISFGVVEDQIAYVHDAETEKQRSILFSKVRNGEIRVLLGSTFKLGIGVNVQDKLIAIHHLDVPWKPSDMTQREGRILRQGNTCPKIQIFRYITEGSFDAYSWQLLETKQRFISDLLSGSLDQRDGADVEDTVLDYAEVKALAVGSPLIKDRVEAANELNKYILLQRKAVELKMKMETELLELPFMIEHQKAVIDKCIKDRDYYREWKVKTPDPIDSKQKQDIGGKRRILRETIHRAIFNNILEIKETVLTNYRGFDIVLPANMKYEKPYIWLVREGRYCVELGSTVMGHLVRIDNFLDSLDTYVDDQREILRRHTDRENDLKLELQKDINYTAQIEEYKKKVEDLDRRLGVDKK